MGYQEREDENIMEWLGEFLAKYWLNFLLGFVSLGLAGLAKRFWSLYKKERREKRKKELNEYEQTLIKQIEEIKKNSDASDENIQKEIQAIQEEIDLLKKGLLSVQGRQFIQSGLILRDQAEPISDDDYRRFLKDHQAYNGLGGNCFGDKIFEQVTEKYNKQKIGE